MTAVRLPGHHPMKKLVPVLLGLGLFAFAGRTAAQAPSPDRTPQDLSQIVAELDGAVFEAFNHCADPAQLARHAAYFDAGVEFYHDNGGVTWTRDEMIGRTRENVCGKYQRRLVPGSLKVYPIRGYGAIAQGEHTFCATGGDDCGGMADFTMVWREQEGRWQITRVLSYGHRPAPTAP